jgi:hypothetical protein
MKTKKATAKASKKMVMIRASLAGVHYGELIKMDRDVVVLKNSRRLWAWWGASLSQVATIGAALGHESSFRACALISRTVLRASDCVEVMDLTPMAGRSLDALSDWSL